MSTAILKKTSRIFSKNKLTFIINITGFSIGIASFIILMLWIYREKGYNQFLKDQHVYQVVTNYPVNNEIRSARATSLPIIRSISQGIPGIENIAITKTMDEVDIEMDNKQTRSNGKYANADLFKVFPRPFLAGSPEDALKDPAAIVISTDVANRLYGPEWRTRMDKGILTLSGDKTKEWQVKGVFEAFPEQSSFRSDFFIPMPKDTNEHIGSYNYEAYLKLNANTNTTDIGAKINQKVTSLSKASIYLQAFKDIHLYSNFDNGTVSGGRILYVRLFTIAAIFLLGMACINFMNLNIASSFKRTKELSVKRMMGAGRYALIRQLIGEAYLTVFIAIVLGLLLVFFCLPSVNTYLAETLTFPITSWEFWLFVAVLFGITGLVASIYPALILTSFDPISVLKNNKGTRIGGIGVTKILFTIQFFISVILIYIAFTTNNQVQYLLNKDLGYDKQHILGRKLTENEIQKIPLLKEELKSKSFLTSSTFSSSNLVTGCPVTGDVNWPGKTPNDSVRFAVLYTDKDFVKTFKVKRITKDPGTAFSADLAVVINRRAAKLMGGEDAIINKMIDVFGEKGRVTGIVEDFNFSSLYNPIEPLIIADFPPEAEYLFLQPVPGRETDAIAFMETLGRQNQEKKTENYFWVEDQLNTTYKDEANLGKRSFIFSIVCVLIALSGFFGLINFSIIKRMREMSIRRIFGSTQQQIVNLIFLDFLKLISVAALIAIPISYLFLHSWLEKFPYRIQLNPLSFIIPLLGMAGLILLIIIFYAFRLKTINPARVLREN